MRWLKWVLGKLLKWIYDELEKSRCKPQRHQRGNGAHGEAGRSDNFTWVGIAVSSLASESAAMTYLGEIDKRSPKR